MNDSAGAIALVEVVLVVGIALAVAGALAVVAAGVSGAAGSGDMSKAPGNCVQPDTRQKRSRTAAPMAQRSVRRSAGYRQQTLPGPMEVSFVVANAGAPGSKS